MELLGFVHSVVLGEEGPHLQDLSNGDVEAFRQLEGSAQLPNASVNRPVLEVEQVKILEVLEVRVEVELEESVLGGLN